MPRSREVGSEDEEEEKEQEKEQEKDEAIEELPVPEDQATERPESPAPRGSGSWCRRCRRRLSDVV
jgi:hypothetical protein